MTAPFARALTALLLLATPIIVPTGVATQSEQSAAAHQKLTFDGDTAFWTVAIKPDKTVDFEQVMATSPTSTLFSPS